ncbi:hemerythrin domain-containing protein [Luedemannella helvata]|uniref:Hemerythrin-like domain-containing protein n=1 Tax=Luedemannella helvata TaxID=349315 RepID=A0ABN2KXD3_9ACTN
MTVPLPPLPPIPGEDVEHVPPGRSLVDVLDDQLATVTTLVDELRADETPDERRRQLADVVVAELSRQVSAERQYLYPTVRALLPDGDALAEAGGAEDATLLRALKDLQGTGVADPEFRGRVDEVADIVHRHAADTAALLAPLREAATDEQLIRLGNRVEMVKEAAPTRPHPAAPAARPWNAVVDPALGVVDKTRDLLTRRTTYAEDL